MYSTHVPMGQSHEKKLSLLSPFKAEMDRKDCQSMLAPLLRVPTIFHSQRIQRQIETERTDNKK